MTNVPVDSKIIIKIQELNELNSEVITNSIILKQFESEVMVDGSKNYNPKTMKQLLLQQHH
jgi:hypothetical protein